MSGESFKAKIKAFEKKFLPHRRIKAQPMGLWFMGLLAAMGFLTLLSDNNILYLLFSCQVAIVIVSGVLSEHTVSRLSFSRRMVDCYAQEPSNDVWIIKNRGIFPAFSIHVGEWIDEVWHPHAYLRILLPGKSATVTSPFHYPTRGPHAWAGIACSSDFPFGFSQKIRIIREAGERLIWPRRIRGSIETTAQALKVTGIGSELKDGEVRALQPGEVWTNVLRNRRTLEGYPLVRHRGQQTDRWTAELDLGLLSDERLEELISRLSYSASQDQLKELIIKRDGEKIVLERKSKILDSLSILKKEGTRWTEKSAS
jgi:hypothetical protein